MQLTSLLVPRCVFVSHEFAGMCVFGCACAHHYPLPQPAIREGPQRDTRENSLGFVGYLLQKIDFVA